MVPIPAYSSNLDKEFVTACLAISQQASSETPRSPIDDLVLPTTFSFGKLSLLHNSDSERMAMHDMVSNPTRLIEKYPNAYCDFYGSGTPCIFKSGPDWPVREGPEAYRIEREARPVSGHPIAATWLTIGENIYHRLDSIGVRWTSINPLAYANTGEGKPFCALILSIGVMPHSLLYHSAVAAAVVVKDILADAGFPNIEVAFLESVVTRSVTTGPKLQSFNPLLDQFADLRKPFTPTLGLPIAPLKYPYLEGTAALYFRLGKDDKRTAILTCAHVARPPPAYPNTGMTSKTPHAPLEEIIALGDMGYNNAVRTMMATIGRLHCSINVWNDILGSLGEPIEGENTNVTERRKKYLELVAKAIKKIEVTNVIHDEVTKHRTTPDQRIIGFVLHSEKIEVSGKPYGFTKDWALIELYDEKIDWSTFKGNKVYVGGNLPVGHFGITMFPYDVDLVEDQYPYDNLLQASGIVHHDEIRNPQHLDVSGERSLLVVKNGLATGTTVGRANSLESFTRTYDHSGIIETSLEIAVLPYDTKHGKFSDAGDSGSIVLARDGRIVGILTAGAGSPDETDISYLTPYWWVEEQIKAKYPGCFLYEIVE